MYVVAKAVFQRDLDIAAVITAHARSQSILLMLINIRYYFLFERKFDGCGLNVEYKLLIISQHCHLC